ncbi:MAG: hypothetical protein II124_01035 [Clostridia bacterium]|nr:hypothetical protein [Clostridia bacterium]MBQ2518021.1 hypothetical protein [Clostridia bacterium]
MKFFPTKTTDLSITEDLERVRARLAESASEKRQKDAGAPGYKPFFGKLTERGFKLTPNTGRRNGYTPVIEGELTEVTESKPLKADGTADVKRFTRLDLNMKPNATARFFSILIAALCVVILGLALWRCFAKGFDTNWWMLLIGPALFIAERLICTIGFKAGAAKALNTIKKLLK